MRHGRSHLRDRRVIRRRLRRQEREDLEPMPQSLHGADLVEDERFSQARIALEDVGDRLPMVAHDTDLADASYRTDAPQRTCSSRASPTRLAPSRSIALHAGGRGRWLAKASGNR